MESPALKWRESLQEHEQYYEKGDDQRTTRVWQSGEPEFLNRSPRPEDSASPSKCILERKHKGHYRVLSMPIVDIKGESIGLVRCVNKLTPSDNVCNFSDDDLVVLDHLLQLAIPSLRLRLASEEEKKRLIMVSHEFKRPVSALRGAIRNLSFEMDQHKTSALARTDPPVLARS